MTMIGKIIGHYRVIERIGGGGMGEVFRAHDERLDRDVALKIVRPSSSSNPDHLRRFEQEARAAAALNHPNIVAVYDVGFDGDSPYIVSELLEGETLRQRLSRGALPVREVAVYATQMAQGLVAAHERRIIHRDLKPENLFLTHDGRLKILDFGVAKLQAPAEGQPPAEMLTTVTKSGSVIGTVAYMSPEQLRGKQIDHRSDIFAVGAILYEMLTGNRAFRGETEVDTMTAVLREEPPEIDTEQHQIPPGFQDIVKHCLEKEPENRFQSARDLVFALETITGTANIRKIKFDNRRPPLSKFLPWVAVAALALVSAVLIAVAFSRTNAVFPAYRRLTFEAGTIYAARFSPDANSIVYGAAWNNQPVHLYSTVGESLLSQPLALGSANLLAISKSNELAMLLRGTHTGQLETENGTLALGPMAGGSPHEVLTDVHWADYDPKGGMAVVHYVNGQSRLEYPIGHVLYQSNGWISHIRFNKQGDTIAFFDHPALWDDRGSVWIVDANGHSHILSREWESVGGLAWSPDGKEIWFSAAEKGNNRNLLATTLKGSTRPLLNLPTTLDLQDVAADGRVLITLDSKRLALAASALGTKNEVDLSWHDWNVAKDISRDGQWALFEDSSEAAGPEYAVVIRKLDGSSLPIRLGEGSAGGLSPDGKWAISIPTQSPRHLHLLPIGTGQMLDIEIPGLEKIANGSARYLDNGTQIIVNGNEPGHSDRCFLIDIHGAGPRPITPEGTTGGMTSPDGRYVIAYGNNPAIALYPIAGGPPRLIPNLNENFNPVQWNKDGSALYGIHSNEIPSKIYRVEIATGKETFIQELPLPVPAGVVVAAPVEVSRDGTHFAYSYNQTLSVLYLISGLH
jgi:eukaryotic-like serine/threonine-protein kinase